MSKDLYLLRATPESAPLLSNLLELYIHDLSPFFPVELGPDGRFGYKKLPLYWSEPELRKAFLIRYGGRLAGFALATRGSPASDNPEDLDVAEFFILRSCRRLGIGCQAAAALWNAWPGRWVVRVSNANQDGLSFWVQAVSQYTEGNFVEREGKAALLGWRVLTFASKVTSGPPRT